tara:strand:- start:199 stop:1248 length:1050 start_codon:yes stop_codon:yes gene_type:complete
MDIKKYLEKKLWSHHKLKSLIKKIYIFFKEFLYVLKNDKLNFFFNFKNEENHNVYIVDTRNSTFRWDSFIGLVRASNLFCEKKWSLIVYEDNLCRYDEKIIDDNIYKNNLINIFFQSILLLPNPPTSIKIIKNKSELISIYKTAKKLLPYGFMLSGESIFRRWYLLEDFNEKDFKNFEQNNPILKTSDYYLNILKKFLDHRNIKKYVTITIRSKDWEHNNWNTSVKDVETLLDYINKNNLGDCDILIIPDTEKDLPEEIINTLKKNNKPFYIFFHGSYSVPLRFSAYSKANFNLGTTGGPMSMLFFIKNDSFLILKDEIQGESVKKFVKKFNENIFKGRKFILNTKYFM